MRVRVLHYAPVLLAACALCLSFAIRAEDVPETAYDESGSLPYESAPAVFIAVLKASTEVPALRPPCSRLRFCSVRRCAHQHPDCGTRGLSLSRSLAILHHSLRC